MTRAGKGLRHPLCLDYYKVRRKDDILNPDHRRMNETSTLLGLL